jgi:hypothetical protein
MVGVRPYDRRVCFLYTDDIVKIVDSQGNEAIFIVNRHESIAQHSVKFTSRAVAGPPAWPNASIPAGQSVFSEFFFSQPARENRLFELRPFLFAVRQADIGAGVIRDGRPIFAPTPMSHVLPIAPWDSDDHIPMGVELVWRQPTGNRRLGTDVSHDTPVDIAGVGTITTPDVGGVNGGFIDAILAPMLDDFSDLWKLNAIYGNTIEFGIANRTNLYCNPGLVVGGDGDNKQYFIGIVGRKHLLGKCPEELKRKVIDEEIDYKTITIGGIPTVTTRA